MTKIKSSMAPSQLKSFSNQIIFLAEQLLKYNSFECSISLETIGDTGIEGDENKIIELKNADYKNHNPLSNSSVDLWKTIFNWATFFYENKEKNINNYKLQLLVFTKNDGKKEIAEKMNNCYNEKQFKELENDIITNVLKETPPKNYQLQTLKNKYKPEKSNAKYYIMCLFSKELYPYFIEVTINFKYYKYKNTYLDNLLSLIKRKYGCSDQKIVDDIAIDYLGWILNEVGKFTGDNKPVVISTDRYKDFSKKYIGPKLDGEKYRTHDNIEPSDKEVKKQLQEAPNYIQQLEIIKISKEVQTNAAYYYLKLLLERRNWIQSGYLSCELDNKYKSYQKKIQRNWINIKDFIDEADEITQGKKIFSAIIKMRQGQFDGINLDPELEKGFIHELANLPTDNDLSIGWHPKYKDLLRNDDENDMEKK